MNEKDDDSFEQNEIIQVVESTTEWNNQYVRKAYRVLKRIGSFCFGSSNDKENEGTKYNKRYKHLYLAYSLFSICFIIWLYSYFAQASKCPYITDADCFNIYIVGLRYQIEKWGWLIIFNSIIPIIHVNNIIFKGVYPIISYFCIIAPTLYLAISYLAVIFSSGAIAIILHSIK